MEPAVTSLSQSIIVPSRLVFLMWLAFTVEFVLGYNLTTYGIEPRAISGLIGVFLSPMLHGGLAHIVSNTIPVLVLGTTLYYFYPRIASKAFFACYIVTGLVVWLVGRNSYHIGASGLIYAIASFLLFLGIFRRDFKSLFISLIIAVAYWRLIFGILPVIPGVSYESHIAGAVVGGAIAFGMRKTTSSE